MLYWVQSDHYVVCEQCPWSLVMGQGPGRAVTARPVTDASRSHLELLDHTTVRLEHITFHALVDI